MAVAEDEGRREADHEQAPVEVVVDGNEQEVPVENVLALQQEKHHHGLS